VSVLQKKVSAKGVLSKVLLRFTCANDVVAEKIRSGQTGAENYPRKRDWLMTDWQIIFLNSALYGGRYVGDYLPVQPWQFPTQTWLQRRLEKIRKEQADES
jgi:hypothetical protein